MIWSIHLHDYVQKLLIFQGWFPVSWKILGLEIAPQLVGKYIIPGDSYRFPKILADGLKGDFSSSSMIRNFGMDFLGGEMLLSVSRYFFELPILKQRAVVVNVLSYPVCFSFMCLICYPGFEENHVVSLFIPQINFLCQQLLWVMCLEAGAG